MNETRELTRREQLEWLLSFFNGTKRNTRKSN